MDASVISYRVVDFLKKHPPFQAIADEDLLTLAARGRVKFHEPNEYILWQGEPHKLHVLVIQQGTVSLWDEADGRAALCDVRGAGDMLGIERFTGAPRCLYSARSESDVVVYGFPVDEFAALIEKYPYARQFVEAYDTVTADYQWAKDTRDPQKVLVHQVIGGRALDSCDPAAPIREVAQLLLTSGSDAVAVVAADRRVQAVVTVDSLLAWIAAGAGSAEQPIAHLPLDPPPPTVGAGATVVDGVMAAAGANSAALAVTSDGSSSGELRALALAKDLGRAFGDQPMSILRDIHIAATTRQLRELNHRARALALQYLTSANSVDWLARFVSLADTKIVKRVIALAGADLTGSCWCFAGASGRGESITRHAPQLLLITAADAERQAVQQAFERVSDALADCDYAARTDIPFERSFLVARAAEWRTRYEAWLHDPVHTQMYLARPLFDLRPVHGPTSLWGEIETAIAGAVNRELLQVLANDCLASLPPLTFFQDAVVDEAGEQTAVFRLEHSALQPLVDVGRVFGLATKSVLGTSTEARLAAARRLVPDEAFIFREAGDTLRILLWQQARIGIDQNSSGSELPPALLSRHERHVLKSGFRSILRLLELTGNSQWFAAV